MTDNNWYQSNDWYAPLEQPKPEEPGKEKHKKKSKRRGRIIGVTVAVLLLAAIVLTSVLFSHGNNSIKIPYSSQPSSPAESEDMPKDYQDFFENFYTSVTSDVAKVNIERTSVPMQGAVECVPASGEELTYPEMYAKCADSVVAVTGYMDGKSGYAWGSGVIISSDGLVVTNTHVIEDCDRAVVTLADDTEYEAKLVGADSISDLAVLKIEAQDLCAAEIGESSDLVVGQEVAAIGNPLGKEFRLTLTNGLVSAISRDISYNGRSMTLIQTNTALNEGNSGGPLFNLYGQVIGITNMKMMSSSGIEGIAFAIPSSTVKSVVNAILKDGEVRGRTSIGITVGAIPEMARQVYKDLPEGLYISQVTEGSDAEAKGLQPGDILTAVNGTPVKETSEVAAIKDALSVGDSLVMTIWRNGEILEITVELMDTNDVYK